MARDNRWRAEIERRCRTTARRGAIWRYFYVISATLSGPVQILEAQAPVVTVTLMLAFIPSSDMGIPPPHPISYISTWYTTPGPVSEPPACVAPPGVISFTAALYRLPHSEPFLCFLARRTPMALCVPAIDRIQSSNDAGRCMVIW
jgi:hypothetical protein